MRGYKKCRGEAHAFVLVELEIPEDATWFTPAKEVNDSEWTEEQHLFYDKGNLNKEEKSRTDKATVVKVHGGGKAMSIADYDFTYEVGKEVTPKEPFDPVGNYACSSGIHFFKDKDTAVKYMSGSMMVSNHAQAGNRNLWYTSMIAIEDAYVEPEPNNTEEKKDGHSQVDEPPAVRDEVKEPVETGSV